MLKTALRTVSAHKLRLFMTALAIMLGVAFVAGTFIFTDTIGKTFDELFEDTFSGSDVIVQSESDFDPGFTGAPPFDEALLPDVQGFPGVLAAEGAVNGYAQLIDKDGEAIQPMGPPTLGGSWNEDERFLGAVVLRQGRGPEVPGEIVVDARTAADNDFAVGDRVDVLLVIGRESFEIVGIVGFGDSDNLAGATFTGFTLAEAQRVMDLEGQFTAISVLAADGVSPSALAQQLEAGLPDDMEAVTAADEAAEAADALSEQLGFIQTVLLVFAAIAVFVGAFMIQNTFRIIVAQRTRELALLRAVGATGGQVVRMVVVESLIVALVASIIGLLAGFGIALLITAGFDAIGFDIPSTSPSLAPRTIIVGMAVGLLVTLFSALLPAIRASRIPPVAALQDVHMTPSGTMARRAAVGTGVLFVGLVFVLNGLFGDVLDFGPINELTAVGVGALVMFIGVSIVSVLFIKPLARVIGWPAAAWSKLSGGLARENAIRRPRRTAATASALMIGLALVAFFFILGESIKASVSTAIENGLRADYVLSVDGFAGGFSPELGRELAEKPEVGALTNLRLGFWDNEGTDDILVALDTTTADETIFLDIQQGSYEALREGGIFVHEDAADDNGWMVGDTIPMGFAATGLEQVEIVGIYGEQNVVQSSYVSGLPFYEEHYAQQLDFVLAISLADGVSLDQGRAVIESAADAFPNVTVRDQAEYRQSQEDQIDALLTLFNGLLILAVIIALLGITNTLVLSVFERTREIGLLRAVGMSRWQVRRTILWESIIVAVIGGVFGIVVGLFFGVVVVAALGSLGVTELALPLGPIISLVLFSVIVGLIASIFPARKAARLNILEAISYE